MSDINDKDYRLDGRETSGVQTANTGEQAKEATTSVNKSRPMHDTTTVTAVSGPESAPKEVEETTKIKAAIAAHNKMATSGGEEANAPAREEKVPPHTKLSAKVSIAVKYGTDRLIKC
jgi:hypothetical protein